MRKPLSPAQVAARLSAQAERHERALEEIANWPEHIGCPPLPYVGLGSGAFHFLVREGLARVIGRDQLDESRFVLTEAGRAKLEAR